MITLHNILIEFTRRGILCKKVFFSLIVPACKILCSNNRRRHFLVRSSERTFLFPMFKEYFKKTCLIIFAAIPLSFIFFCILQHFLVITTYETRIEQRVYVTDTGKHYHSYECGYLRSKNAIGRTKAVEEGYTPCAVCLGFPNGEIEVVYEKTKCNTPLTLTLSILAGLLFSITVFWIIDNKKIPSDDD